MRKRKKRPYHYKPTTLTLAKLIELIDSGQEVIDLNQYSNGATWFRSLREVSPALSLKECSSIRSPQGREGKWWMPLKNGEDKHGERNHRKL